VFPVSRSSLFVGPTAYLDFEVSETLFGILAAKQLTAAAQARAVAVTNDQMLEVAIAYVDLLEVYAELQIVEETYENARVMYNLTESYERAGKGAAADTARARTEVDLRESQYLAVQSRIAAVSARLAELLLLQPDLYLRPVEPALVPIAVVPEQAPLGELIAQALTNRPELAENQATIAAALERWRGAKLAPLVPNLRLSYAAGGFGGGLNSYFGDFDGRHDFAVTAFWELKNFGLGNLAMTRERLAQYAQTQFRQAQIEARVAAEVVAAFRVAYFRRQQLAAAQRAVEAARRSYQLNEARTRRAPEQGLPIELLQAIQALYNARRQYLQVVADYNRAQFQLYTALGSPPLCALDSAVRLPTTESTVPAGPGPTPPLPRPERLPDNAGEGFEMPMEK
jgi:outer membrane protein TolC